MLTLVIMAEKMVNIVVLVWWRYLEYLESRTILFVMMNHLTINIQYRMNEIASLYSHIVIR